MVDYFDKDSSVFLLEPKRIAERAKSFEWEQGEILEDLAEKSLIPEKSAKLWAKYEDVAAKLQNLSLVSVNSLTHSAINYTYKSIFNFNTKTTTFLPTRWLIVKINTTNISIELIIQPIMQSGLI